MIPCCISSMSAVPGTGSLHSSLGFGKRQSSRSRARSGHCTLSSEWAGLPYGLSKLTMFDQAATCDAGGPSLARSGGTAVWQILRGGRPDLRERLGNNLPMTVTHSGNTCEPGVSLFGCINNELRLPNRGTEDHRGPKFSLPSSGNFTDSTTKSLGRRVLAGPCDDR
jgi:hypothetical protein